MHTLPFVKLLAQREPEASIEYIVGSGHLQELLENTVPYINKVWLAGKKSLAQDLQRVRAAGKVDEFIFLHSAWWKSWWLNLRFIGASKVVGYKRDDSLSAVANYASSYFPELRDQLIEDAHQVLESKVLDTLSLRAERSNPEKYICIVPGVGHLRPHRAYPLKKWMDLIEQILNESDYQIKILGGPDEIELSKLIEQCIINLDQSRIENLIGKTSLLELARLVKAAEHLYSADTGILHIAAAAGCPTTSIFSITSPRRFAPFDSGARVIQAEPCLCNPASSNRPKACEHLDGDYASCMKATHSLTFTTFQDNIVV